LYAASPLTDNLSFDIALTARDQDKGWGKNLATGEDYALGWMWGGRVKTVWRPGDRTKITWSADVKRLFDNLPSGFPLHKDATALALGQTFTFFGDYNVNSVDAGFTRQKVWGTALTIEHEFDWATLTSLSG